MFTKSEKIQAVLLAALAVTFLTFGLRVMSEAAEIGHAHSAVHGRSPSSVYNTVQPLEALGVSFDVYPSIPAEEWDGYCAQYVDVFGGVSEVCGNEQ